MSECEQSNSTSCPDNDSFGQKDVTFIVISVGVVVLIGFLLVFIYLCLKYQRIRQLEMSDNEGPKPRWSLMQLYSIRVAEGDMRKNSPEHQYHNHNVNSAGLNQAFETVNNNVFTTKVEIR